MKKIALTTLLLLMSMYILLEFVSAQSTETEKAASSEPEITKTSSDTPQIIQDLKEKIATKVAELRKSNKKIIKGTVYSLNGNELKVKDKSNQIFTITLDELAENLFQLTTNSKKKIEKNKLIKEFPVLVYGSVIESSLSPDRIYMYTLESVFEGRLQRINSDYSIEVISSNGSVRTFDIETSTKQKLFDKTAMKIIASGFSKYKEGDYIIANYTVENDSTRSAAIRTIIIPQESIE
jgi:hypothetical protein